MNKLEYGFNDKETQVSKFFDMIPIYPKITTAKELSKVMGVSIVKVHSLMLYLPVKAPVIQDFGIISRLK